MVYEKWAETYDLSVRELSRDTWVDGIAAELLREGATGGAVLDVAAGTGIGGMVLSHIGHYSVIDALDISECMKGHCQFSYGHYYTADARSFSLDETYDVVVSGFDSINYIAPDGLAGLFQSVRDALKPGGLFVFDYSSQRLLREEWLDTQYETEVGEFKLSWKHHYNRDREASETTLTLLTQQGFPVWSEGHLQYALGPYEIYQVSKEYLSLLRVRNLDNTDYSPSENTHVYVFRKLAI